MLTRQNLYRLLLAGLLLALLVVPLVGMAVEMDGAVADGSLYERVGAPELDAPSITGDCSGGSGASCGG